MCISIIEVSFITPIKNTPIYTYSDMRQAAVRRMAILFTALYAANTLRMLGIQPIISA